MARPPGRPGLFWCVLADIAELTFDDRVPRPLRPLLVCAMDDDPLSNTGDDDLTNARDEQSKPDRIREKSGR